MGVYLHSKKPFLLFQETVSSTYFVDKSQIIKDLIPLIDHTLPVTDGILKERGYALRFQGKLGEQPRYTGRILPHQGNFSLQQTKATTENYS